MAKRAQTVRRATRTRSTKDQRIKALKKDLSDTQIAQAEKMAALPRSVRLLARYLAPAFHGEPTGFDRRMMKELGLTEEQYMAAKAAKVE